MAANKRKSPTAIGLGESVLPDKRKVEKILTDFPSAINTQEAADLVLAPFFDIMGRMKGGAK